MNYEKMKPHGATEERLQTSGDGKDRQKWEGAKTELMPNMERKIFRGTGEAFWADIQEIDALIEHRCTDFGMDKNIIPRRSCLWIWNY